MVENSWGILSAMYQELRQRKFNNFDISKISNIDSLYAAIVARWCLALQKEGLYKGYVEHVDEEMQSPQGQINVQKTIADQTMIRGQLVCTYDELSDDVYMNHLLKGTLQYFLQMPDIQESVKTEVKKALVPFSDFGYVDITRLKWKQIRFNNNTIRYKNLIDMCKWVFHEKRFGDSVGLTDTFRVYNLYKKGLFGIVQQLYNDVDTVTYFEMPYTYENEPDFETKFFKHQPMAVVSMKGLQLIYMIRLQNIEYYDKDFHIPRLKTEELVQALKKYEEIFKVEAVGVVLQINLNNGDYNVENMSLSMLEDHMVGDLTIDLWDKWKFIQQRMGQPYDYFIMRKKERMKRGYQK